MANERVRTWHSGGQIALTTTGASLATATMSASAGNLNLGGLSPARYPHAQFTLKCQFATATSIENKVIELHARRKNIQSTNHGEAPTSTWRAALGVFSLRGVANATDQFMAFDLFDVPQDADWYVYNLAGQTISANWGLWAYPFTFGT